MATIQESLERLKLAMLRVAEVEKKLNEMAVQCNHEPRCLEDRLQTTVEAVQDGFDAVVMCGHPLALCPWCELTALRLQSGIL